jgi:DNA-binding transcriptional LysR family regulator
MEQLQEGQQWLTGLQAGQRGTIRIGCIESLATAMLPALFATFHQRYPLVRLKVRVNHTDELIAMVEQGEIELGLILDPHQQSELLIVKELFRQPLHLLVSAQHPLAQAHTPAITLEHITTEPLLLLNETSRMGQITKRLCTQRGLAVRPSIEIESVEGLEEIYQNGGSRSTCRTRGSSQKLFSSICLLQGYAKSSLHNPEVGKRVGLPNLTNVC